MYTIKLRRQNHSLNLKRVVSPIRLQRVITPIRIRHIGPRGLQGLPGPKGDPGIGVPEGGHEGQVLAKTGSGDYDTQWVTFEGTDKTYTQYFNVTNEVLVNHNLGKYPTVSVVDSAGDEVEGEVYYPSQNQVIVRFLYPFSGRVTCN